MLRNSLEGFALAPLVFYAPLLGASSHFYASPSTETRHQTPMALQPSTTTADIGFRPPQFSDDLDWLPAWLQPHVAAMPLAENENADTAQPLNLHAQELFPFKGSNGKTVHVEDLLLMKEKGDPSFHLYLSGEDNTPLSWTASNEKMLRFRLHLSADGSSPSTFDSPMDISQNKGQNSSVFVRTHVLEKPLQFHIKTNEFKAEDNHGCLKPSPGTTSSRKLCGYQCGIKAEEDKKKVSLPIVHITVDAEVSSAVELSVAASEALVIHETIHNEPYMKVLPTTAILDLALQVKEARLECSVSNSTVTEEKANETDALSDLDDSDMEDAYEDVGLLIPGPFNIGTKNDSTSRVLDTPISQQLQVYDRVVGNSMPESQEYQVHDHTIGEQSRTNRVACMPSEYLSLDSVHTESQKLLKNNQDLESVPGMVIHAGTMIEQVHVHNLDDSLTPQGNYGFGGSQCRRATNMAGNLITETSFFSESGCTAPDAHSFAHNYDKSKASSSYTQIGPLCQTNGTSQASSMSTSKNSSLHGMDPLCSVVPCSLTEIYTSSPVHDNDKRVAEVDEDTGPQVNSEALNMQKCSGLNIELVCIESEENTAANVSLRPIIKRQTTSLKAYSVLLSDGKSFDLILPKRTKGDNQLTYEHNIFSVNSLTEKDLKSNWIRKEHYEQCGGSIARHTSLTEMKGLNQHPTRTEIGEEDEKTILQNFPTPPQADFQTEKGNGILVPKFVADKDNNQAPESPVIQCGKRANPFIPTRKRVRLNESDFDSEKKRLLAPKYNIPNKEKKRDQSGQPRCYGSLEVKERLTKCHFKDQTRLIFRGLDFLLTGFSVKKSRGLERILRKHGGVVLSSIPSLPNKRRNSRSKALQLPVILCSEKLQTSEFLYGCAANAFLLHVDWMTDSIGYGSVLPPDMYLILPNHPIGRATRIEKPIHRNNNDRIFGKVGIMLHGEHSFCSKFAEVIKHGDGRVYKTLHWLVQSLKNRSVSVGVIVAENETYATRHLRKCASEHRIAMMSSGWIVNSLYNGKLLPIEEDKHCFNPAIKIHDVSVSQQWTQEI